MSTSSVATATRWALLGISALIVLCLVVLVVPEVALAAPQDAGENIGEKLKDWSKVLFVGVVGLFSLRFLVNQRYTQLAIFAVAALVVGFLQDGRSVRQAGQALAQFLGF